MAVNEKAIKLAEAQRALHKLVTGTAVVKVTKDGMTVEYTQSNLSELKHYIERLELEVNGLGSRRAPAGVMF